MLDYVGCIGLYFPTVFVVCTGDPNNYADITWDSGDAIPSKDVLDAKIFDNYKAAAVTRISAKCEAVIMDGFTSQALGSDYRYASQILDQINLIGAIIACQPNGYAPEGTPIPYKCAPVVDGVVGMYDYHVHSPTQMTMVFMSGVQYKLAQLTIYQTKQEYINTRTTKEQVDAITWDSNP